jgi:hypothetical protein
MMKLFLGTTDAARAHSVASGFPTTGLLAARAFGTARRI